MNKLSVLIESLLKKKPNEPSKGIDWKFAEEKT
jgi:hypothetical protein